jgi:hypothetical protein
MRPRYSLVSVIGRRSTFTTPTAGGGGACWAQAGASEARKIAARTQGQERDMGKPGTVRTPRGAPGPRRIPGVLRDQPRTSPQRTKRLCRARCPSLRHARSSPFRARVRPPAPPVKVNLGGRFGRFHASQPLSPPRESPSMRRAVATRKRSRESEFATRLRRPSLRRGFRVLRRTNQTARRRESAFRRIPVTSAIEGRRARRPLSFDSRRVRTPGPS